MANTNTLEEKAMQRAKDLLDFYYHFAIFVIVNFFLFLINLVTSPGSWWFVLSIFGWGIGLTIHAMGVFVFDRLFEGIKDRMYESELERLKRKQSRK